MFYFRGHRLLEILILIFYFYIYMLLTYFSFMESLYNWKPSFSFCRIYDWFFVVVSFMKDLSYFFSLISRMNCVEVNVLNFVEQINFDIFCYSCTEGGIFIKPYMERILDHAHPTLFPDELFEFFISNYFSN